MNSKLRKLDIPLPEFPAKRNFGNLEPEFVESRKEALEKYLKGLTTIERVVQFKEFKVFLI